MMEWVTAKQLRKMSDAALTRGKKRRVDSMKRLAQAITAIDREVARRMPRKIVRVAFWSGMQQYRFTVNGRVVHPTHGRADINAHNSELEALFRRLHITHVQSELGETETSPECIKDGTYTVHAYLKWWRQTEED